MQCEAMTLGARARLCVYNTPYNPTVLREHLRDLSVCREECKVQSIFCRARALPVHVNVLSLRLSDWLFRRPLLPSFFWVRVFHITLRRHYSFGKISIRVLPTTFN